MSEAVDEAQENSPESDSLLKDAPFKAPVGTAWRKASSVEEVAFLEEIHVDEGEAAGAAGAAAGDESVLAEKSREDWTAGEEVLPEMPREACDIAIGLSQRVHELGCFTCEAHRSECSEIRASSTWKSRSEKHGHFPGALLNMVEPHSPRQLALWRSQQPRFRRFQIQIAKKGQKLGIRYDDSDKKSLVLKIIEPGVFYDSIMKLSSEQWAMPEDRIIEVNGVCGNSEWLEQQCMTSDVLEMTVERPLPAPGQRIFCQNEDATVMVHAYDLFGHGKGPMACVARTLNSMSTRFGLFHTGVEVFGHEWFFGASMEGLFHGVNATEPKQHPVHRYRTSVTLGATKITCQDFEEVMPLIRMKWPAWSYHPISRNCHSFTDFFCKVLGFPSAPRFGLFGSGDSLSAGSVDVRALAPCGGCVALKAGEGRALPASPSSDGSCIRVEA